jgi:hypothetical protein
MNVKDVLVASQPRTVLQASEMVAANNNRLSSQAEAILAVANHFSLMQDGANYF